jgi:hypothetical protein
VRRHGLPALRNFAIGALAALCLLAALLAVLTGDQSAISTVPRPHAFARQGLLTLPALAQGPVSAALGNDTPAYRIHDSQGALWASSPAARLRSSFTSSGVSIRSGHAELGLRLEGVGFGSTLAAVRSGTPTAHGNRVSYTSRAGITQWYANGPLGLEQGFTVSRAPAHRGAATLLTANQGAAAPLTLAIGLSGNTKASVGPNAGTISLTQAGTHALRYTNLSATDARGRALHSWLSLGGGRILLHVDARGASYPLRIDPLLQGEVLTNGGPNPEDFAYAVALSANGSTALVGDSLDEGAYHGAAFVFVRSGNTWTQQAKLTAPPEGFFGASVALSANGNTALVSDGTDQGPETSRVYVFTRSGSTWTRSAELHPAGSEITFGSAVALSENGDLALVGEDNYEFKGAVYVFTRSGEIWSEEAKLTGTGEVGQGEFGASVALSGDEKTALIGGATDGDESPSFATKGAAWVFTRSSGKWVQQGGKLTGAGQSENAEFASAVSLSENGDTALIGAPSNEGEIDKAPGAAWVFTRSGETWGEQAKLTGAGEVGEGSFGAAVALTANGNTALIGGPTDNEFKGAVWEFTRSGSTWSESEKLTASGLTANPEFGRSLAMMPNGETALIGAPYADETEGAALVFAVPPLVSTGSAAEITTSTATPSASVNPGGEEFSECKFEYGTTTAYGTTKACSPASGSGEAVVHVSASITGLSSDTTYHFRAIATNKHGVQQGADQTFTTLISSKSGSTENPSVPATASDGELSMKASDGTGSISLGDYGADIGGIPLFQSNGKYDDFYRGTTATFTDVEIKDCEVGSAKELWWFKPTGGWKLVSGQSYVAGSPACITATLTETTNPSVGELTGTRFGTGEAPGVQEYGKCEAAKDAVYTESACGTIAEKKGKPDKKGKYEWYPAPVTCFAQKDGRYSEDRCATLDEKKGKPKGKYEAGNGAFTGAGAAVKLEIHAGGAVECTGGSSEGQVAAPKQADATITFTGCKHESSKCTTSGQGEGTIKSEPLQVITYEEDKKVLTGLVGNPVLARFTCASTAYALTGAVSGETATDVNVMSTKGEMTFRPGAGEQALKTDIDQVEYEATLSTSITTTSTQPLEIDTKVDG